MRSRPDHGDQGLQAHGSQAPGMWTREFWAQGPGGSRHMDQVIQKGDLLGSIFTPGSTRAHAPSVLKDTTSTSWREEGSSPSGSATARRFACDTNDATRTLPVVPGLTVSPHSQVTPEVEGTSLHLLQTRVLRPRGVWQSVQAAGPCRAATCLTPDPAPPTTRPCRGPWEQDVELTWVPAPPQLPWGGRDRGCV